jgi:hypothetical protein
VPTTVHDASTVGGSSGTVMSALMNEFMARDSPSFSRLFEPVQKTSIRAPRRTCARSTHLRTVEKTGRSVLVPRH